MTTQQVWLTQEAYDKLKAEYDQLTGPGRAEITSRIEAAREEGDLKENGGYHAAKDEQGKQEARIRQLDQLLRDASVGETPAAGGAPVRAWSSRSVSPATRRPPASCSVPARTTPRASRSSPRSRRSARGSPVTGRRHRQVQAAERQRAQRRDHLGGALHRLTRSRP